LKPPPPPPPPQLRIAGIPKQSTAHLGNPNAILRRISHRPLLSTFPFRHSTLIEARQRVDWISVPRLEVREIVMQFPAVRALDGVFLTIEEGEVHGIIGENGAGKSTLMRILAGLQEPTSGSIALDGKVASFSSVGMALSKGIAMIHQELNLADSLTAAENVFLGKEPHRLGVLDRKSMNRRTAMLLERVGAAFGPEIEVGRLSIAGKQLVEIAKALSYEASILIMDEPTAVLSETETESLFKLIEELKKEGVTVIYISHRLAEVERICDRITVLRDGSIVRTLKRDEALQTEMATLMVGRPMGDMFPSKAAIDAIDPILKVKGLADGQRVFGVDLELKPKEIVGLAGLIGSGRTELGEMIVGVRQKTSGSIERNGRPVSLSSPAKAAREGIAYVTEDRKESGLVLSMNVIENTTLANLKSYAHPLLDKDKERSAAEHWQRTLDIRAHDLDASVLYLSGGNQQKVSIAKWLELTPEVLILDEPTRGVDVGAKKELYQLIHDLAANGMTCLVISSELPELIGICHRILVMRHGKIVGEVSGEEMTEEGIMLLAAGVQAA
jgi:ribose transport system ATP-binding protein